LEIKVLKIQLEQEEIDEIAQRVVELLKPLISGNNREVSDNILTPETLAQYLRVDISWVYRRVSERTIPFFKNGKYVRFKKSSIDRWIASHEKQPFTKLSLLKIQGRPLDN